MSGITDLDTLLASLSPHLCDGQYVFVSRPQASYGDGAELKPIASISEEEGLTLVVSRDNADTMGEAYTGVFRMITLRVHSSLEAIGLTAAVANCLSNHGISVNVLAGFYHDYLFVPASRAGDASRALAELATQG